MVPASPTCGATTFRTRRIQPLGRRLILGCETYVRLSRHLAPTSALNAIAGSSGAPLTPPTPGRLAAVSYRRLGGAEGSRGVAGIVGRCPTRSHPSGWGSSRSDGVGPPHLRLSGIVGYQGWDLLRSRDGGRWGESPKRVSQARCARSPARPRRPARFPGRRGRRPTSQPGAATGEAPRLTPPNVRDGASPWTGSTHHEQERHAASRPTETGGYSCVRQQQHGGINVAEMPSARPSGGADQSGERETHRSPHRRRAVAKSSGRPGALPVIDDEVGASLHSGTDERGSRAGWVAGGAGAAGRDASPEVRVAAT